VVNETMTTGACTKSSHRLILTHENGLMSRAQVMHVSDSTKALVMQR